MDLVAAADQEGCLVIWKISKTTFHNLAVSKICHYTITQGIPVFIYFIERGTKLLVACSTGCILVFSITISTAPSSITSPSPSPMRHHPQQYQLHLERTILVDSAIQCGRVVDSDHVMIATTNQLILLNHCDFITKVCIEIDCTMTIQHFDISPDGQHAIIITDEILYYNLTTKECNAHLSTVAPVCGMCMTNEYLSFFLSQDRHVEKWVIDWEIECNKKEYFPPLSYHLLRDRLQ